MNSGIWWRVMWCIGAGLYGVTTRSAGPDDLTRVTMKVKNMYFFSGQIFLTRVWTQHVPPEHHVSGLHNAVRQVAKATKSFVVALCIFGYPVWNFFHVTFLTPETFTWHADIRKFDIQRTVHRDTFL